MGTALHVKSPRAVVRAGWPLVARSRVLQERRKERIMNERNDMQAKLGTADRRHTILIIGISRGIGRGLAAEYLRRGWFVIGTVRSSTAAPALEAMAAGMGGRLRVERLDMTRPSEIGTLRERLADDRLDVLLVNAGIPDDNVPVAEIDEATFNEVMSTNVLAPLKVIESFQDLVVERGTIDVMSSRQGSISLNDRGSYDIYRASKAALNHLVRSYAARHSGGARTLLLIAPGWVQTDLGGSGAPVTVEQVVPGIIDTIDSHRSTGGLRFVDAQNEVVPW